MNERTEDTEGATKWPSKCLDPSNTKAKISFSITSILDEKNTSDDDDGEDIDVEEDDEDIAVTDDDNELLTAQHPLQHEEESSARTVIKVPAQRPQTLVKTTESGALGVPPPPPHLDLSSWLYRAPGAPPPLPPPPFPPSSLSSPTAVAAAAAAAAAYHLQLPPNILASKFAGEPKNYWISA